MSFKSVFFLVVMVLCSAFAHAADTPSGAKSDPPSDEQRLKAARERLNQAAREVAELSTRLATEHMPDAFFLMGRNSNRAMLGLVIGAEGEDGVSVLSVSPGGPAAKAGIKAGDVLVEINGKSLKRDQDGAPPKKLMEELAKLTPDDEATLRYLRDGKAAVAKVKVERLPPESARRELRRFDLPDPREFERFQNFLSLRDGPFSDMDLAPLSPKLAQYFGTDKGLLVVHAPENKDVKLEDGDVLVDIDGRAPSNPGHAFRILGSYQPGEKVTLNVVRQKKKMTLALTIPESGEHAPRPPHPPRAPAPPNPARAPTPAPTPGSPI